MVDLTVHFQRMAMAVFVAYRAFKNSETPVACVFVDITTGDILAFGCNNTNDSLNGTRHAEFEAIDKILKTHGLLGQPTEKIHRFFENVALYVTIEPCVMCALALSHIGLKKVYFGAANDRFGGNGTVIKVQSLEGTQKYSSYGGFMRPEAVHLLRLFYIQENQTAPTPQVKKNKEIDGKAFPPNLEFLKYVDEGDFRSEYGEQRTELFFPGPNENKEVTPILGRSYLFRQLAIPSMIEKIPKLELLYPETPIAIEQDINDIHEILPPMNDDGEVDLDEWFVSAKRRKVDNESTEEICCNSSSHKII